MGCIVALYSILAMPILHNRANLCLFTLVLYLLTGCTDSTVTDRPTPSTVAHNSDAPTFKILILGDSLTEGYDVPPSNAYPFLLEKKLNSQSQKNSRIYQVINGGVTGSTTSGGASRIEWYLKSPPDFLIVALGGNDGLRGIPPSESKENLSNIILRAQAKKVPVLLAGMKLPPNYGFQYIKDFENMFPQLAEELNVPLLPFLLEGVGGNPKMNLPDRIHPNSSGHQIICQTVYEHLTKYLSKNLP